MTITVYDEKLKEWRRFTAEPTYAAACSAVIHQFVPLVATCACGKIPL